MNQNNIKGTVDHWLKKAAQIDTPKTRPAPVNVLVSDGEIRDERE